MSIPGASNAAGDSVQMAVNSVLVPEEAVSGETGGQTANTMCEVVQSNTIGLYRFDFTRLLSRTLGSNWVPSEAGPYHTILGLFKQIRFGRGYMKITRVDSGGRASLITVGSAAPVMMPYLDGNTDVPLKIHYIRLRTSEPSWSEVLLDPRRFMADPRHRTVSLMPNKSITFSFSALSMKPHRYLAHMIRDYSNTLSAEQDQFRRLELPGSSSRLGWISTLYAGYTNYVPVANSTTTPGMGAGVWRIVSPTIAFCFEYDVGGTYNVQPITSIYTPPAVPFSTTFSPISQPTVRRSESCTVRLRGLVNTILAESTYGGTPYSGVGKIFTAHAWNSTTGFSATPNVVECFDPPRFSGTLTNLSYANQGPLYRDSMDLGGWSFNTEIPLDTQHALIRSAGSVLPIPAAGTKP